MSAHSPAATAAVEIRNGEWDPVHNRRRPFPRGVVGRDEGWLVVCCSECSALFDTPVLGRSRPTRCPDGCP